MIKSIIFDLDGTLSDTSYIHYTAYKKALKEVFQFDIKLVEDSTTGILAAFNSGAHVYRVKNPDDLNNELIELVKLMNEWENNYVYT